MAVSVQEPAFNQTLGESLDAGFRRNALDCFFIDIQALVECLVCFLRRHVSDGAGQVRNLFEQVRLTVAQTHENKFKALRPRFEALRQKSTEAFPITKVNLDGI